MKKVLNVVVTVLSIVALCLSAFCFTKVIRMPDPVKKDLQYVLYLGTNDKDTDEPVLPPDEAKEQLKKILIQRFGGYTITDANGGWIGNDGTEYQEYTLVIYLSDTSLEEVHSLCDELIDVYDQNTVLIQANETTTEFYSK
ncbi:hypothetical protein [Oribacterium sp. P6A1]|uniref:hypothetical protein n=1 Tax=Oribacterium sp. P6A1 TaxID=1410612 RepID=UPI000561E76B|nr:hypothetical protein [Oribacterium sp. P6A1]